MTMTRKRALDLLQVVLVILAVPVGAAILVGDPTVRHVASFWWSFLTIAWPVVLLAAALAWACGVFEARKEP